MPSQLVELAQTVVPRPALVPQEQAALVAHSLLACRSEAHNSDALVDPGLAQSNQLLQTKGLPRRHIASPLRCLDVV